jgi:hypothetical protein
MPDDTKPLTTLVDEAAPGVMADLIREFQKNKDYNARTKLRLRIKGLLDYLSADTEYPPAGSMEQSGASTGFVLQRPRPLPMTTPPAGPAVHAPPGASDEPPALVVAPPEGAPATAGEGGTTEPLF